MQHFSKKLAINFLFFSLLIVVSIGFLGITSSRESALAFSSPEDQFQAEAKSRIFIKEAYRLDENGGVVENVYDQVKAKDDIWSSFTSGQSVRVTFEGALDNTKDITLSARSGSGGSIEVYVEGEPVPVAVFEAINQEKIYQIYLSNLKSPADVFDLKIKGDVDIDWIVDPDTMLFRFLASGGSAPHGSLALGGSTFYGMAFSGGRYGKGIIFSVATDGTGFTTLHEFAGGAGDGSSPYGSLIVSGGKLYGTTMTGGITDEGVLFSLNTDGTGFSSLHDFTYGAGDGIQPSQYGELTLSGSTLYGMTYSGGSTDSGIIYAIDTDGSDYTIIHNFTGGAGGAGPYGSLTLAGSTFYGMTRVGGSSDKGVVFSMNISGSGFTVLHNFAGGAGDGSHPNGSLIMATSTLYGATSEGGTSDNGTIFSLTTGGTGFVVLHEFNTGAGDGINPHGALTLSGNKLYGTAMNGGASSGGAIFSIDTDGTDFATLREFAGGAADGYNTKSTLVIISNKLYGITTRGGDYDSGTIFSIDTDGTDFALPYEFHVGGADGSKPQGSLIISGSTLYGMTRTGGSSDKGLIFSVSTSGTGFTALHQFAGGAGDGATPFYGDLTLSGSTLYGMTFAGGSADLGVIFSLNTNGTGFTTLHEFAGGAGDGSRPYASLIASGTKLYGQTFTGGAQDKGVVFSINTNGTGFTTLHEFAGGAGDGANPYSSLALANNTLYGTTVYGGSANKGVVFSLSTSGAGFAALHEFPNSTSDGNAPYGSVVISGSKLYGMAMYGRTPNKGIIFSLDTNGSNYATLHIFAGGNNDGKYPNGSLTLSGSKLYGMTTEGGTADSGVVFSLNTNGTNYSVFYKFVGGTNDGANPFGSLILSGGLLYGTTEGGGASDYGAIFSIVPNSSPTFAVDPADSSATSTPVNEGNNVSFTATAADSETNNYYLAVCKTDSVTANNNAAPTCDSGQTWCVSGSTAASSSASCSYAAQAGDSESSDWYAFVCDYSANSACSSASQGSGGDGSPFKINHDPSFTAISAPTAESKADEEIVFSSTASDPDTEASSSLVALYVCKANDFNGTGCGAGGEWCHSTAISANPSCSYKVASSDGSTSHNYYAYVADERNLVSTAGPKSGVFITSVQAALLSSSAYSAPSPSSYEAKIVINNNAAAVSNRLVTLNFSAGREIKKMAISAKSDFSNASQEEYQPSKLWDLCSGLTGGSVCSNGKYTVYAKFYNAWGQPSGLISADVILSAMVSAEPKKTEKLGIIDNTANAGISGNANAGAQPAAAKSKTAKINFSRNLQLGSRGEDVKNLQKFLNSHGYVVAKSGAGSPGKETALFGALTRKAVIKFQENNSDKILKPLGLKKGTGNFYQATRKFINDLSNK
ncbi:MAG: peptidoglycan-binding protein [Patescibacteria group bacterium]|nr:peptidoglycan-binding protein [Patescibacteria group bacterium]